MSAHSHRSHGQLQAPGRTTWVVSGLLAAVAVAVAIGAALLWPSHITRPAQQAPTVSGHVSRVHQDCAADGTCLNAVTVRLTTGPDKGQDTNLEFTPGATDPELRVGDTIRLARISQGGTVSYQFDDISRGRPLVVLALLFVVVVVAIGRLRGLAALLGLVVAGVVLVLFVLPALLDGRSPLAVALVAGAAITLVVLPLSHGASLGTAIAMLGTLTGMVASAVLAAISISALRFTGLSGEENATLSLLGSRSTVSGLLLAGAVIGALGVLNDVTVTQVAAVSELSGPGAKRATVFAAAMRIGREHIASTVYSLVLAYTGSALPVLLLFSLSRQSTTSVLASDAIAPEVAAGLIGGIALVLVVPITTAVASALIVSRDS
jgi:uncharacterized membrane protein